MLTVKTQYKKRGTELRRCAYMQSEPCVPVSFTSETSVT
jgi:hypothetical protein